MRINEFKDSNLANFHSTSDFSYKKEMVIIMKLITTFALVESLLSNSTFKKQLLTKISW